MPKLVSLLEAGERGRYADLQWFYHYMERSDAMIASVLQRRRAALLSVDWDIRQVSGPPSPASAFASLRRDESRGYGAAIPPAAESGGWDRVLAEEQAAVLSEVYDGIDNFRDAVSFLFTGFFRGYAHVEKHFADSGLIHRLEPVEQWFWVREGLFGDWEYNENAVSGRSRGLAVEPGNFVIFEPGSGALNRILAVLYLRKSLSQKDWDCCAILPNRLPFGAGGEASPSRRLPSAPRVVPGGLWHSVGLPHWPAERP